MSDDAERRIEDRLLSERGLLTQLDNVAGRHPSPWLAVALPQGATGGTVHWEGHGDTRLEALQALEATVFAEDA